MLARRARRGRILGRMAAPQTFRNHAHRPTATIVGVAFTLVALWAFGARFLKGDHSPVMIGLLAVTGALLALLYISRVYTVKLQDRIIRLEMRVRGAALLTPEQQQILHGLPIKKVVALRFASDAELPVLLERAAREPLTPSDIKRAVTNWTPDQDRT